MIQKLKLALVTTMSVFAFLAVPALVPATVGAQDPIGDCLAQGSELNGKIGEGGCDNTTTAADGNTDLTDAITFVINVISVIVGFIAVVMIIWGGARYITSGGDSGKVSNAKNTIIYAIIGLIIVALAQFIVQFVLTKTGDAV